MKKALQALLLTFPLLIFGQDAPNPYKFTSIIDLYEFPSSGSTGILETSLPLYTIQSSDLQIPLTLNYDQMGNTNVFYKGNQFGDAWVFNPGGTISRSCTDLPGAEITYGNATINCNGTVMGTFPTKRQKNKPYINDENYFALNPTAVRRANPDVYTFNVNGLTGKFIIERLNGVFTAKIIEKTDFVKIEIGNLNDINNIEKITIYDKKGYKYIFSNPSNINHNQYMDIVTATSFTYINNGCTVNVSPLHTIHPGVGANGVINANDIISAVIYPGSNKFWESLELTEIYDNNNRKLISYEYESVFISSHDMANSWVNGMGMFNSYNKLFLKKINIINQGQIIFNNEISTLNKENVVNSFTKSIEIINLRNELIKKIDFNYQTYISPRLAFSTISSEKNQIFSKRFLTKIIESDGSSNKNLITTLEYNNMHINGDNTLVDRYGFLANSNEYCTTHLKRSNYKADFYILKKIKYPTGGAVIYNFGPNKYSGQARFNFTENNGDNHLYVNKVGVTSENNTYRIPVNPGDTLAILNKNSSLLRVYTSNILFNNTTLLETISRKLIHSSYYVDERYCKHEFKKVIIPENYSSNYIYLRYDNSQTNFFNNVKVYKFSYKTEIDQFLYAEGNRIEKIGYFTSNVSKNILDSPTGEDQAEKIVEFKYDDIHDVNKSSGKVRSSYITDHTMKPYHVIYEYNKTLIKNVGYSISQYNIPSTIWGNAPLLDIKKQQIFSNDNNLVSETHYNYLYHHEDVSNYTNIRTRDLKPFITKITSQVKSYEGEAYISRENEKVFSPVNGQLISDLSVDNLGKAVKINDDYSISSTAPYHLTHTSKKQYVNNTLKEELHYTYDAKGNLLTVKFKTPEMSALEQIGTVNTYDSNGNLINSVGPDGVSTCYIWGYNNTKIVAKLVNISYADFISNNEISTIRTNINLYSNFTIKVGFFTIENPSYNEVSLGNTLAELHQHVPNALVTCYVYKPMIGITRIIDENGKATRYEYDTYNRLRTIKDHLGNILKEYEYNFTN